MSDAAEILGFALLGLAAVIFFVVTVTLLFPWILWEKIVDFLTPTPRVSA